MMYLDTSLWCLFMWLGASTMSCNSHNMHKTVVTYHSSVNIISSIIVLSLSYSILLVTAQGPSQSFSSNNIHKCLIVHYAEIITNI